MSTQVENPVPTPTPLAEPSSEDQEFAPIDSELKTQIRKGFLSIKIAVCINLNKNDIAGFNTPQPYYVSFELVP
jgi:hypothetical protein